MFIGFLLLYNGWLLYEHPGSGEANVNTEVMNETTSVSLNRKVVHLITHSVWCLLNFPGISDVMFSFFVTDIHLTRWGLLEHILSICFPLEIIRQVIV